MDEILNEINISQEVKSCIVNRKTKMATLINIVECYEQADWDNVGRFADILGIRTKDISEAYMNALNWYLRLI